MVAVKPKDRKYDLEQLLSLSLGWDRPLSLMRPSWVSVCEKWRVSLSIYTSFWLDNYLLGPTSLGESNNPSAHNYGDFAPLSTRRGVFAPLSNYFLFYDFTWLNCINDSPDRNIGDQWNTIYEIYKWIYSKVTNRSSELFQWNVQNNLRIILV